jgi:GntR family transcriptional regulator
MTPRATPFFLQLQAGDPRPLGRQIVEGVRRQIASGELPEGALLPSVRVLAAQLLVNPNTVAKAYAELTADGWLMARAAQGVYVAAWRERLSPAEQERRLDAACEAMVNQVLGLSFSADEVAERVRAALSPFAGKVRSRR